MADIFPIPLNLYQTLSFSQQYLHLFRYTWLNNNFSVSYNFLCFSVMPMGDKKGRIKIVFAQNHAKTYFDERYCLEYNSYTEEMAISFIGDRFKVVNITTYEGEELSATTLQLQSSTGEFLTFYGTIGNPFDPVFNKIYGIPPAVQ